MNAHLGDFGIASLVLDSTSTEGGHSGSNSSVVGHSGLNSSVVVTGTIEYIAPGVYIIYSLPRQTFA